MEKVYIVEGQTISCDDTYSAIVGVHATEEGARKRMYEEIDERVSDIKDDFEDMFYEEDYAEDFEGFETFEEFWANWVNEHFVTQNFWRYSDETDFTYVVSLTEKNVED